MISISTPERCIVNLKACISKPEKAAFFSSLVMGLMTHAYVFVNKLYNYDELVSTPGGFVAAGNNRWFLEIMGKVSSKIIGGNFSLPLFFGVITLLLLAISALLVVRMFQVKSTVLAVGIGGLFVTFPAVTSLFFFMFTAPYYAVGIFLSILGAYFVIRHPKKILYNVAAVVVIACSLGTYQAYFPNTVCLLVISIVLLCAFTGEEYTWQSIFMLGIRYVIVLALAMVLYFVLNRVLMSVWGVSLALGSYQGMDTMGQISVKELLGAIKKCYESFFALGHENVAHVNMRGVMQKGYRITLALFAISTVLLLVVKKGEVGKKALMMLGFLVFPVAMFLTYVMAPAATFYTLMAYAIVFWLIFLAVWTDYYVEKSHSFKMIKNVPEILSWISNAVICMFCVLYMWYGNGNYMAMEYTKMHDLAYFQTMVTQIKSTDGYSDELKLALLGTKIEDETTRLGSLLDKEFVMGGRSESNIKGFSGVYLISKYLGYAPEFCSYEELKAWMEREEVKEMPCYPKEGSIQIMDGTIIVKMSED